MGEKCMDCLGLDRERQVVGVMNMVTMVMEPSHSIKCAELFREEPLPFQEGLGCLEVSSSLLLKKELAIDPSL
jgi:hypothetical protein